MILGPQIVNAGRWIINPMFSVYVRKRPCWLHRTMSRLLLGWQWEDGTVPPKVSKECARCTASGV